MRTKNALPEKLVYGIKMEGKVCAKKFLVLGLTELDGLVGNLHRRTTNIRISFAEVVRRKVP